MKRRLTNAGSTAPARKWKVIPTVEVIGNPECPLIHRWTIIDVGFAKLLLHHFLPNAEDVDFHDHPRPFVTFVVKGDYTDESWRVGEVATEHEHMDAPMFRYRPANYCHRTFGGEQGAWTVVIMGPIVRKWGFVRNGRWMPWKRYIEWFGNDAKNRCP